ncbi:EAL domain-containing protein [Rhodoferax sp. 4810]|nr:EAL domain-containing protein [Rhodoferax jenense]
MAAFATGLTGTSRFLRRWSWWLAGVATLLVLGGLQPAFMQRLDLMAYDLLVPTRPVLNDPPVVIAIDNASLNELGRWPWPRARHAQMLDRLGEAGAAAIGMAVFFPEPDLGATEGDAALKATIASSGKVVLPLVPMRASGQLGASQPTPSVAADSVLPAVALGHVDVEMDVDGQARRLFLQGGYGQADTPALALAVRQRMAPPLDITQLPGVRVSGSKGDTRGLWMRDHEVLLPRMRSLPTLSFASVLRNPEILSQVQHRAVFVGVTATGLGGELVTPLNGRQTTLPGVEFHAQAYAALMQQALIQRTPGVFSVLLGLLLVTSLVFWSKVEGRQVLWVTGLLGVPLLISALILHTAHGWLPPALATLSLAVALVVWLAARFQRIGRQLQQSREHSLATLQAIGDGVVTLDAIGRTIAYANPTAARQSGRAHLPGMSLQQAFSFAPDSLIRLQVAVEECLRSKHRVSLADHLSVTMPGDPGPRHLSATVSPLCNPEGQIDGVVLVLSDVTDALAATRERDYAATHDALTGLPNRVLLHERLGQVLARALRRGNSAAILFLDLNRFKHINDSLGHSTGDEVLKIVAQRLRQLTRDTDTVARWGGDEFVIVLEDLVDHAGAATAATKVIDSLSRDIDLDEGFGNLRLPCAVSVGVVMSPQDGSDIDDLLSKADMAMYRAKAQPQASFQFWSDDSNTGLHARLALEVDMRQGLREQQFVLHYQPQFAFKDRRLVGMEVLMRWQRGDDNLVMPGEFINVAEGSGLIVDLGAWAVLETARQIARWLAAGLRPVPLSVNVSARQCLNRDLVQVIRLALKETGIPPALLRLEITETTAMADADQVIGLLLSIRALGVGLVLDDFGTGYSSLTHLKRFPVDELKIDRSFVTDLATSKYDLAIVRATIALAHGLDIKVVAEGVETLAQSRFLASESCDIAQGYLYGFPQPANIAEKLL